PARPAGGGVTELAGFLPRAGGSQTAHSRNSSGIVGRRRIDAGKGCKRYGAAVQAQAEAAPEATARPRALDAIGVPLVLVAISALAHVTVAWMQVHTLHNTTIRGELARWDAGIYLKIAKLGYPTHLKVGSGANAQTPIGFYPLFPLLVRGAW